MFKLSHLKTICEGANTKCNIYVNISFYTSLDILIIRIIMNYIINMYVFKFLLITTLHVSIIQYYRKHNYNISLQITNNNYVQI